MKRLEKDRLYHCRLEGAEQTGHLSIGNARMSVQLFDYDGFFHLSDGCVLHLRLEDGRLVSLHDTVAGSSGNRSILGEMPFMTYAATVHANTVVTGYRSWASSDEIRRTLFTVKKAKPLLENMTMVRRLARGALAFRVNESRIFEVHSRDLIVRCSYGGSGSLDLGLNEWWPAFEIEFSNARNLSSYVSDVHRVLRFFSAAAGFQLSPSEISISRFSEQDNNERLKRSLSEDDYPVEYMWSEATVRDFDLSPHYSFVCAFDANEMRTMGACLTAWLDRPPEWEEASALMMGSLGLHDQFSGERLLMACRWLEKIPSARAEVFASDEALRAITNAATEEARNQGITGVESRISGALQNLRNESNRDRFSRLVTIVGKRFPDCGLDQTSVDHLMLAQALRGRVAHGAFEPEAGSVRALQRAFTATEALSYLLMIKDLPLPPKSRHRAISSRVVREYRYAKVAPDI